MNPADTNSCCCKRGWTQEHGYPTHRQALDRRRPLGPLPPHGRVLNKGVQKVSPKFQSVQPLILRRSATSFSQSRKVAFLNTRRNASLPRWPGLTMPSTTRSSFWRSAKVPSRIPVLDSRHSPRALPDLEVGACIGAGVAGCGSRMAMDAAEAFEKTRGLPSHRNQPILSERIDINPKVTLSAKKATLSDSSCAPST